MATVISARSLGEAIDVALSNRFQRAYNNLTDSDAERVKKVQGTDHIWEASASLSIRLTFEMHSDLFLLRNVGAYDETLKKT